MSYASLLRVPILLRRFRHASAGVAAVEFALVLPVMLLIFVGMSELSQAIGNWRSVTRLARAVSDLTSQGDKENPMRRETMNDILASSKLVLGPFDSSTAQIVVSALGVDITNLSLKPQVCSSIATSNATARKVGPANDLQVPPGYQVTGTRYILTEVSMPYKPMLGSTLVNLLGGSNGQITFSVQLPWPTRGGRPYGLNPYSEVLLPDGKECQRLPRL